MYYNTFYWGGGGGNIYLAPYIFEWGESDTPLPFRRPYV